VRKATLRFQKILQDTHDYDAFDKNGDHMVSKIEFSLAIDDKRYMNLVVEVRQPFGADFATDAIEVSRPKGYDGAWNHSAFSDLCEEYYRQVIGPRGAAIGFGPRSTNVSMRNNLIVIQKIAQMDIPDEDVNRAW
jgi:hypothetical protein